MDKNCNNCGRYIGNNSDNRNHCKVGFDIGADICATYNDHYKWAPVRDIRKGIYTGKIVDATNNLVLWSDHKSEYSIGDFMIEDIDAGDFTKLNYSGYKPYIVGSNKQYINDTLKESTDMNTNKLQYKSLKTISLKAIYDCDPCNTEFGNVTDYVYSINHNFTDLIFWTTPIETKVMSKPTWLRFLLEHKFIEKVQSKTYTLRQGDKLTFRNSYTLWMYQIAGKEGLLFSSGSYCRHDDRKYTLNTKLTLSEIQAFDTTKEITHINGEEV